MTCETETHIIKILAEVLDHPQSYFSIPVDPEWVVNYLRRLTVLDFYPWTSSCREWLDNLNFGVFRRSTEYSPMILEPWENELIDLVSNELKGKSCFYTCFVRHIQQASLDDILQEALITRQTQSAKPRIYATL